MNNKQIARLKNIEFKARLFLIEMETELEKIYKECIAEKENNNFNDDYTLKLIEKHLSLCRIERAKIRKPYINYDFNFYKNEEVYFLYEKFTKREKEVFDCMQNGLSFTKTLKKLDIAKPTLEKHILHIKEKFEQYPGLYKEITSINVKGFYGQLSNYINDIKNIMPVAR